MALEGVIDVSLEWAPQGGLDDPAQPRRKNLVPRDVSLRPIAGAITAEVGGALVMLDVTATILIKGAGLLDDPESAKNSALAEIEAQRSTLGAALGAVRKAPLDAGGRRSSFWATRSRSSGWAESSGFPAYCFLALAASRLMLSMTSFMPGGL